MALTDYNIIKALSTDALEVAVLASGLSPYKGAIYTPREDRWIQTMVAGDTSEGAGGTITGYRVVTADAVADIEREVLTLAASSYVPLGDVEYDSRIDKYYQTLVIGTAAGAVNAPAATETTAGTVMQAATQADSVAATLPDLVTDFNALLAKLKAAGIVAAA